MRRSPLVALAVFASFVSMNSPAAAQTATGQITGTVRDATGAVMAGVKVVVTNQQTGLNRETKTGSNGEYVLPLLPAGEQVHQDRSGLGAGDCPHGRGPMIPPDHPCPTIRVR